MGTIDDADQNDFLERLKGYGLDESAVLQPLLTTVPSAVTALYMSRSESALRPIVLKTNDFDDLNKWIGVPDGIFDQIDPFAEPPRREAMRAIREPVSVLHDAESARASTTACKHDVEETYSPILARDVARAYLYGDSRKLQRLKPWLSERFPSVEIALWPFLEIIVKSGSVLEFGPGPNVLVARRVTIEKGGVIRTHGHLKIDVTILERAEPRRFVGLNPALMKIRDFLGR